jgi:hypothetical protein
MKKLFSRYGRKSFQFENNQLVFGNNNLSVNIDELLENHSHELNKNLFYISSYEINCDVFGEIFHCPNTALKICSFDHDFTDLSFQSVMKATTSVYMMPSLYENVIATIIKTESEDVESFIGKYPVNYDIVLLTWFRNIEFENQKYLSNNEIVESTLLILFKEMEISFLMNFEASKTAYGKKISQKFIQKSQDWLNEMNENEISLVELIKREYRLICDIDK